MKNFLLLTILLIASPSFAQLLSQKTFHYDRYKQALSGKSYIHFKNDSVQLGLITQTYTGVALDFRIQYQMKKEEILEAKVEVPITSIDTDHVDRNKKMHHECLDSSNFPYITVTFTAPIKLILEEQVLPAKINIRGHEKPITITVRASKDQIEGSTKLSFKALDIPNPSLFVVDKVKDEIDLEFKVLLNE